MDPDPTSQQTTTGPTFDEIKLTHRTRLVEHHEIVVRREGATPFDEARALIEHCQASAEVWAEQQGVELTDVRGFNQAHYDHTSNPSLIESWCDWSEVGVQWTVDVGRATNDEWTWSARWEHWRAWFESMRLAAQARSGIALKSASSEVMFRDVSPRLLSAFTDPDWGADVDVVVNGDDQVVAVHPREDDTPEVDPRITIKRGPVEQKWAAQDDDGPSGLPHFTLSAPPGFLPPGDYTITRTRIPGPDVDAVHDAAWEGDDDDES